MSAQAGKTIHLGIGYSKHNGGGFHRSKSIITPTNITMEVYQVCMQLFQQFYDGHSMIRRVYITLGNLYHDDDLQLNLFEDQTKKKNIGYVMDEIRNKYGPTAILRASSYTDAGILLDRSKKIGGHYS